jgi:hypothetical protein
MAGNEWVVEKKLLTAYWPGSKEGRESVRVPLYPPRAYPQLPPARLHLLKFHPFQ